MQPAPAYASLSSQQISHALLRDFLRHANPEQASQAPPRAYYAGVEQELAELRRQAKRSPDAAAAPAVPHGYRRTAGRGPARAAGGRPQHAELEGLG